MFNITYIGIGRNFMILSYLSKFQSAVGITDRIASNNDSDDDDEDTEDTSTSSSSTESEDDDKD